jgi:hypothetical protein
MRIKTLYTLAAVAFALAAPAIVTAQGEVVPPPAAPPLEQPVAEAPTAEEAQLPAAEEQAPVAEPMATEEAVAAPSAPPETDAASGEELPRTASPLALLALLGLGSAGTALGLRVARLK